MSRPRIEDAICDAAEVLNAGVNATTVDGVQTTFDLEHIERRSRLLKRKYWARAGYKNRTPFSQPLRAGGSCE